MPKKRTILKVNVTGLKKLLEKKGWSNAYFCETLMKKQRGWFSEWIRKDKDGNPSPKNLPSPEEAARMCVILQVRPEEILTEQEDIELVTQFLESQKQKPTPEGEPLRSEAKQKLVDMIDNLNDDQCEKLYKIIMPIIAEAKELF